MSDMAISDLVQAAKNGEYDIPEFQREFIWRPIQVADLADSLSRGYPIGCLVVWKPVKEGEKVPFYVVDGQQRMTALCIMFGERPSWKETKEWEILDATYTLYLNVSSQGKFSFGRKRGEWVSLPVKEILAKNSEEEVNALLSETLDATKTVSSQARAILYEKGKQVWNVKSGCKLPVVNTFVQDPLEVAEIYKRLNETGTRIRETDTQLAFIAVKNPGWVKGVFRAFIKGLEAETKDSWSLTPGLVLRCMTILDSETPRVGNVKNPEEFWTSRCKDAFDKLTNSIRDIIPRLERYGIQEMDEVPSDYTLIALFSLHARFSKEKSYDFGNVFKWFLNANLTGRYSGAGLERLTEDAGKFMKSNGPNEALKVLEIPKDEISRALDEELTEPFRKRSPGALILKVLLWDNALDWRAGGKLSKYPPLEWHHIVPKKVLQNLLVGAEGYANIISNMTLLSETANKEFRDKPPWIYGSDIIKDPARLESHLIPKSYAMTFIAGKAINRRDELGKFLSERLKLVQKEARRLLL